MCCVIFRYCVFFGQVRIFGIPIWANVDSLLWKTRTPNDVFIVIVVSVVNKGMPGLCSLRGWMEEFLGGSNNINHDTRLFGNILHRGRLAICCLPLLHDTFNPVSHIHAGVSSPASPQNAQRETFIEIYRNLIKIRNGPFRRINSERAY